MMSHSKSRKAQQEANKRWFAKHPEKVAEYRRKKQAKRKWRMAHDAVYAEAERAKARAYKAMRRAMRRGVTNGQ